MRRSFGRNGGYMDWLVSLLFAIIASIATWRGTHNAEITSALFFALMSVAFVGHAVVKSAHDDMKDFEKRLLATAQTLKKRINDSQ